MFYAFKIYEKQLFPYLRALQIIYLTKQLLITEDNVRLYYRARELMAPKIEELKVIFPKHLKWSPDLHPIEYLFRSMDRMLDDFRFKVIDNRVQTQAEAEAELERIWCRDNKFA